MSQSAASKSLPRALMLGAALIQVLFASQTRAFPVGTITFKDNSPFMGAGGVHSLTSSDGLLTVSGWADVNASVSANLYQWWWLLGVDSGAGNPAFIDGQESMTLQYDKGVGASHIFFLDTGGSGGNSNLARISISGFAADPGAFAITATLPRIFDLNYSGGALTFDYLSDGGGDYGQLLFANPSASVGQTLKITGAVSPLGDSTSWGAALFSESSQEAAGGPTVQPQSLLNNALNSYTTADGGLTIKGYADRNLTTPANFGLYLDQCFGVDGGHNSGAVDGNETVALQFATGYGLSRLESIYSSAAQVTISGFLSDPGFNDLAGGSTGAAYANGVLSFYPLDGGYHVYYFTNRAASAGRTLRINSDGSTTNYFAIAAIGYANIHTLIGPDIPNNLISTYTTADGLLTLSGYSDTPGSTPANIYENVDWFGIAGGANNEAIDGTESMNLHFSGGAGLTGLGTRYTSGQVIISGFTSDPGFTDPSGLATGVSYSAGTLSYTFNQYRAPELLVTFTNLSASAGQTLSLHTDGNAGSQIAVTRINYTLPVSLSISKVGGNVVLTWPIGTLQKSPSVSGTYTNVVGATSPYTNAVSAGQGFFRIKVQ